MSKKNPSVHLITFATFKYIPTAILLIYEAMVSKWFKSTKIYTPTSLKRINRDYLRSGQKKERGYGYWFWKPMIIFDKLSKIKDGDILVYLDAGFMINRKASKRFNEYLQYVNKVESGLLVFELSPERINDLNLIDKKNRLKKLREVEYTKKAVLDVFDLKVNDIDSAQIQGSPIIIKKNAMSLMLVQKWYEYAEPKTRLFKNPELEEVQNTEFIAHRNDQSVLSCLLKSHQVRVCYSAYETWVSVDEDNEMKKMQEMRIALMKYPFICLRRKVRINNLFNQFREIIK